MPLRVVTETVYKKRSRKFARFSTADRGEQTIATFLEEAKSLLNYMLSLEIFAEIRTKIEREMPGWKIARADNHLKERSSDRSYELRFPCDAYLVVFEKFDADDKIVVGNFFWPSAVDRKDSPKKT